MKPYEKTLEHYLCEKVRERGGMCIKLTGVVGIPDRLIVLPNKRIIFVELKREGEKPRAIQDFILKKLMFYGFDVMVLDSKEDIRDLL